MSVKVYRDVPRVYLDMDGPLAEFDGYCKKINLEPNVAKLLDDTYPSLLPTEGSIEAVHKLLAMDKLDVFVLTKIPSKNLGAASDKLRWLDRYLPMLVPRLIVSPDKGCVGTARDYLVDDHPEWANAHNFPGRVMTFKTASGGMTWDEILAYFNTRFYSL